MFLAPSESFGPFETSVAARVPRQLTAVSEICGSPMPSHNSEIGPDSEVDDLESLPSYIDDNLFTDLNAESIDYFF